MCMKNKSSGVLAISKNIGLSEPVFAQEAKANVKLKGLNGSGRVLILKIS